MRVPRTVPRAAGTWKEFWSVVEQPSVLVGHFAPDLDCITAIWLLKRFANAEGAELQFVPSGQTLGGFPADSNPSVIHVDTGGGRFDHHQRFSTELCAAELVRRAFIPNDTAIKKIVYHVCQIDNARQTSSDPSCLNVTALIAGYNQIYPDSPAAVVAAMLPNLDAWYHYEQCQAQALQAFAQRIEFDTPWGMGIAVESETGGSSTMAYGYGAVLYAYRDARGWMGIAAQSRSAVDLSQVYAELRVIDAGADWYLHPNRRLLLCGTAKSPPRSPSRLSLVELVAVIENQR